MLPIFACHSRRRASMHVCVCYVVYTNIHARMRICERVLGVCVWNVPEASTLSALPSCPTRSFATMSRCDDVDVMAGDGMVSVV